MSTDSSDLNMLTLQVYTENKVNLDSLKNTTVNTKVPEANEFLQDQNSKDKKIKRPPNSYIIFSVLLNKYGLLDIIRNFCENHKINKQRLVPISKIISKNMWNELSIEHKNIFSNLAVEVEKEHKRLYPDYKYQPNRKKSNAVKIRQYKPKINPADHISFPTSNPSIHVPVIFQDEGNGFGQMNEGSYEDSYEGSYEGSHEGSYEGSYEGSFEGSYESSYEDSYESSYSYEDSYESSYGGSYGGSGSYNGSFDDDLPKFTTYAAPTL
uniref:MATA-HMG n=1 Tax=Rhizophagus irregularis TaxID=588596 RepID=A0A1B1EV98_9GLOM|nr:MATA-HMG [Rhizophagus irregularis]ANQ32718.1 MATA-HMG [Rhizophagus irregularis]